MGMTFTTLHLYAADRDALVPLLRQGDMLRDQNAPWLSVVPAYGPEQDGAKRLDRLAKRLTKDKLAAAALVFDYFDDDLFLCRLYRDGKTAGSCRSNASWAKLGRALNNLFGDDFPAKALRYASRCNSLEEQVSLLEETVGAALFDVSEAEPRRVQRSDTTLRAIQAREAIIRKRPKQFVLTELARADWPERIRLRETLLEVLRPQWQTYHLSHLLYHVDLLPFLVPGTEALAAYPYIDFNGRRDGLLFYDGRTGSHWEPETLPGKPNRAVWQTSRGETDVLFHQTQQEHCDGSSWSRLAGKGSVICLARDGAERWRFVPEMNEHQTLEYVNTSDDGIITLFASGINAQVQADGLIWQIDGETGRLLRSRSIPAEDEAFHLVHAAEARAFVYGKRTAGQLVVLNELLEETAHWQYPGNSLLYDVRFRGEELFECRSGRGEALLFDLRTGRARRMQLEIPVFHFEPLPDGRFVSINESQNRLTVFDREGRVASRCRVPGEICGILAEQDGVYIAELRGPDYGAFVCDALFDETETHVWRLEPTAAK